MSGDDLKPWEKAQLARKAQLESGEAVQVVRLNPNHCPLYPVRPYQVGSTEDADDLDLVMEAEEAGVLS